MSTPGSYWSNTTTGARSAVPPAYTHRRRTRTLLSRYGIPFLIRLDEVMLPKAYDVLDSLSDFVGAWRRLLDV